jgi:general L-amino acid transport system substrate-binding protein
MRRYLATIAGAIGFALLVSPGAAQTLNTVKARGYLNCGSNTGVAGFGIADKQGNWTGFDVEFCRALAAAIFDDANKVKFIPTTGPNRFTALRSG